MDLEQQEPFQSSCKWAFPVHKPIKAAKGTVTDGSKVSKYEYDKEFHRKKEKETKETREQSKGFVLSVSCSGRKLQQRSTGICA